MSAVKKGTSEFVASNATLRPMSRVDPEMAAHDRVFNGAVVASKRFHSANGAEPERGDGGPAPRKLAGAPEGAVSELPRPGGAQPKKVVSTREALDRCADLIQRMPPMETPKKYVRSWSIQDALDQHQVLQNQREALTDVGRNRLHVRQTQVSFAELDAEDALLRAKHLQKNSATEAGHNASESRVVVRQVKTAMHDLKLAVRLLTLEEQVVSNRLTLVDIEVEKSQQEMSLLKLALDDTDPAKRPVEWKDTYRYCCNCMVGGHGQRFCEYLLKRPTWRVYPNQKWFIDETKGDQYYSPLGKRMVDFTDETQFSRVAMYLKGRVALEDKTKLFKICPDTMLPTYTIHKREWDGEAPAAAAGLTFGEYIEPVADRGWFFLLPALACQPSKIWGIKLFSKIL
jgi:hypothetical protein